MIWAPTCVITIEDNDVLKNLEMANNTSLSPYLICGGSCFSIKRVEFVFRSMNKSGFLRVILILLESCPPLIVNGLVKLSYITIVLLSIETISQVKPLSVSSAVMRSASLIYSLIPVLFVVFNYFSKVIMSSPVGSTVAENLFLSSICVTTVELGLFLPISVLFN